ncbi:MULTISPECIES: hypothetical protein [unclassified Microbacterium]|uniref:hypothetical protein n=1 Tax=unclassified Microbacterium TaxID=2609290 RepID=UPI000EAAA77C|nr:MULTISPECIES: hypothetical protein [unclassified Microbacterium]MBT2484819.1 hypothetical protein [Microbacterium sp. ISL-108]RKN67690.1 hypothetical protein D7252_08885 [Microbacterium sp. CGR2]
MAETPSIKIQIDEAALKEQVTKALQESMQDAAMRLRSAADALDGGRWITEFEEYQAKRLRDEFERGRRDALAENRESYER